MSDADPTKPRSDSLTQEFLRAHAKTSAHFGFGWVHRLVYFVLFEALLYIGLTDSRALLTVLSFAAAMLYLACVLFRLMVIWVGVLARGALDPIEATEVQQLDEASLPTYTVLVPLYREANIVHSILASLSRLDYPAHLLDVKLLLEADDAATIEAVQSSPLPACCEALIVPVSVPRTKPKACNHGLAAARGGYVVIYDAEDRPEADQLKKAIIVLRAAPADVACVQAKLNYYNADQNPLTRWFTIEYTMWFEFFLPGLSAIGAAIPLGGTSNHFRTDVLRKLGGWDPFNVTEDCDLGIRIYRAGYRTLLLDSTTWEEATSRLGAWMKQRSRWIKGFLQTHVAHTRDPVALVRSLGPWRSICFLLTVGWTAATLLINLVFWAVGLVYAGLLAADAAEGRAPIEMMAGDRDSYRLAWKLLYYGAGEDPLWSAISITCFGATVALLLANMVFIGVNCLACSKSPAQRLVWSALSCPVYWVLISLCAVRGAVELFTKPFHWSKTTHGLAPESATIQISPSSISDPSQPESEVVRGV